MDPEIIRTAWHETGHTLMAYYAGIHVESVTLHFENNLLTHGSTRYDFTHVGEFDNSILLKRLIALLGGPLSQKIYESDPEIDLNNLGTDGDTIRDLLASMTLDQRLNLDLQGLIGGISTRLSTGSYAQARENICNRLIEYHQIHQPDLNSILTSFQLPQLQ